MSAQELKKEEKSIKHQQEILRKRLLLVNTLKTEAMIEEKKRKRDIESEDEGEEESESKSDSIDNSKTTITTNTTIIPLSTEPTNKSPNQQTGRARGKRGRK